MNQCFSTTRAAPDLIGIASQKLVNLELASSTYLKFSNPFSINLMSSYKLTNTLLENNQKVLLVERVCIFE